MRIKAKRAVAVVCSVAMFAAVPAAPAVAGGGGGGKKAGDSQKVGPNQCRNQKGIQVNVISCNNLNDGLF